MKMIFNGDEMDFVPSFEVHEDDIDFSELPNGRFECNCVLEVVRVNKEMGTVTYQVHSMEPGDAVESPDDDAEDGETVADSIDDIMSASEDSDEMSEDSD